MLRIISFSLGGLVAAGVLVVLLPPAGKPPSTAAGVANMDETAAETGPQAGLLSNEVVIDDAVLSDEPAGAPDTEPEAANAAIAAVPSPSTPASAPVSQPEASSVAIPAMASPSRAQGLETLQWEPIWAPFRRRMSAEGFARRVTNQSGIETVVVKDAPGSYQVMIARRDSVDRVLQLLQIQEVTGLNLVGER